MGGGGSGGYPEDLRAQVDGYLESLSFSDTTATAGLEEAMRYSLLAGGKRIRPVLSLATAQALGREPASVMPFAAALELIHTYSLIHDDLPAMDDDELRRGRPTCHVAFGEDVAILAGDGLFAEALHHLLEHQADPAPNVLAAAIRLVTAAGVEGMVGGQYMDVTAAEDLDPVALRDLHERKTGRLIGAAIEAVLLLSGDDGPATIALQKFAAELGVLFQIVDDILDVTGDDVSLGKPGGSDARHGKQTYVSVYGLERARELAEESHSSAREALTDSGYDTETLTQITDYILTRKT